MNASFVSGVGEDVRRINLSLLLEVPQEIEIFVSFFEDGRFVLGFVSSHENEVAAFSFFKVIPLGQVLDDLARWRTKARPTYKI